MNRDLGSRLLAAVLLAMLCAAAMTARSHSELAAIDADPQKYLAHARDLNSSSLASHLIGLSVIAIAFTGAVEAIAHVIRRFMPSLPGQAVGGGGA